MKTLDHSLSDKKKVHKAIKLPSWETWYKSFCVKFNN